MYEGGLDEHGEVLTFSRRGRYVPRSVGSRARTSDENPAFGVRRYCCELEILWIISLIRFDL